MKKGFLTSISAYILWGFFPLFFKALDNVPPLQILSHRIVWSFILLLVLSVGLKRLHSLRSTLSRQVIIIYAGAGFMLSINWLVYVYSVTSGQIVESSLGYFINPLVSVLLGVLILRERLRTAQWITVGLAGLGVAYLTFSFGTLPWIALVLAFSFGFYGLIKKIAPLGALDGLTLETTLIFLPACGYLVFQAVNGSGAFIAGGWWTSILLSLSGLITVMPLFLFATGARLVPLNILGLLQFIAPTMQFLLGVFIFKEPFTSVQAAGFSIIWIALIIFSVEAYVNNRKQPLLSKSPTG